MKVYLIPTHLSESPFYAWHYPFLSEIVGEIQFFLAENEKTARRFVSSLKIGIPVNERIFFRLDKDTTFREVEAYFGQIPEKSEVGILSEAGCPGIADPGALAVSVAHQKSWEVIPLVGGSSLLLALMASGFNGQSFAFQGYLPIEKNARQHSIKQLSQAVLQQGQTQIFIETPYRNQSLLADILLFAPKNIKLCIASDLTSVSQYIKTLAISQWQNTKLPDLQKKPTVFLLGR